MNNILSIDLDILLSPYVGIYNNAVNTSGSCHWIWHTIDSIFETKYFTINQSYQEKLKTILNYYSKQVNKIYIGFDHSSILTAIENEKEKFKTPYKFDIYNIDYHHDIFYSDTQEKDITAMGIAGCGNWVGFLTYHNFVNHYCWYNGIGSNFEIEKMVEINKNLIPHMEKHLFDEEFEYPSNVDVLFISISPQWIPLQQYDNIKQFLLQLPQEKIEFIQEPFFNSIEEKNFLSYRKPPSELRIFNFLNKENR